LFSCTKSSISLKKIKLNDHGYIIIDCSADIIRDDAIRFYRPSSGHKKVVRWHIKLYINNEIYFNGYISSTSNKLKLPVPAKALIIKYEIYAIGADYYYKTSKSIFTASYKYLKMSMKNGEVVTLKIVNNGKGRYIFGCIPTLLLPFPTVLYNQDISLEKIIK
jgi:hypothetical protein